MSAVLVTLKPGADLAVAVRTIAGWPDVSVYTKAEQRDLLLRGSIDRARRQIGLFRAILVLVSAIIMALIIYTLTLDKAHDIAMLKLIGARNRVIIGLILQQALILGFIGYGVAWVIGQWLFPHFPRLVLITDIDLVILAGIVLFISLAASGLGIWKALRIQPNTLLSRTPPSPPAYRQAPAPTPRPALRLK